MQALPGYYPVFAGQNNRINCNIFRKSATNNGNSKEKKLNQGSSQEQFLREIQQHAGILHKICRLYAGTPADREDLFQEIIIQLWKSYSSFRGEAKFTTWMYRIALNTAITGLRKKNRTIGLDFPGNIPAEPIDTPEQAHREDMLKQLYDAIATLSELERAIVMLYLDDRSYEEMEEVLGINQNNLRVKMNRIKNKLRQLTKS